MPVAQFVHGDPLMVDHTPSAAVAAGDVLLIGVSTRIAHLDIAANEPGSLAAGFGVYDINKTAGVAIGDGVLVYWDNTNKVVNVTASGNTLIGRAVGAALAGAATCRVQHIT